MGNVCEKGVFDVHGNRQWLDMGDVNCEELADHLIEKNQSFFAGTFVPSGNPNYKINWLYSITFRTRKRKAEEIDNLLAAHGFKTYIKETDPNPPLSNELPPEDPETDKEMLPEPSNYTVCIPSNGGEKDSIFEIIESCGIDLSRVSTPTKTKVTKEPPIPDNIPFIYQDQGKVKENHWLTVNMEEAKKLTTKLIADKYDFAVTPEGQREAVNWADPKDEEKFDTFLRDLRIKYSVEWNPTGLTVSEYRRVFKGKSTVEKLKNSMHFIRNEMYLNTFAEIYSRKSVHAKFVDVTLTQEVCEFAIRAVKKAGIRIVHLEFKNCELPQEIEPFCSLLAKLGCNKIHLNDSDSIGSQLYKVLQDKEVSSKIEEVNMKDMSFILNLRQAKMTKIVIPAEQDPSFVWNKTDTKSSISSTDSNRCTVMGGISIVVSRRGNRRRFIKPPKKDPQFPMLETDKIRFSSNLDSSSVKMVKSPLAELIYIVDKGLNCTLSNIYKL